MPNFTMTITNTFSPNTVISSSQMNVNLQTDIRDKFNSAFNSSTGHTHSGSTGDGAPTVLQNASPNVLRQLGYSGGLMQFYDGSAVRTVTTTDNTQTLTNKTLTSPVLGGTATGTYTLGGAPTLAGGTISGATSLTGAMTLSGSGAIDASTIVNGIKIPDADPTADRGIGYLNNILKIHDGTSARSWIPIESQGQGLFNIAFAQGADSSQLKITAANGSVLSASNPGYVRIRSSTAGTYRTFTVTADVTIDLTGAHWGLDGKGNVTGAILRVYVIDDNGTLRWGVGYQGGFNYIRNTQDDTTGSNVNLPEEILTNSGVGTDNSPMLDVGWILANFTDATNEWAITEYHPNESADGIWHPWSTTYAGFSANPSGGTRAWMQVGQTVWVKEFPTSAGTSNSTSFTMTLPTKARYASDLGGLTGDIVGGGADSGTEVIAVGRITTASTDGFTLSNGVTVGNWTNSGSKAAIFRYHYIAYQP